MLPLQDLKLNYAVYVGNSEDSYIKNNLSAPSQFQPGQDTSKFKLVGGRIGLDYDNLKAGVSSTFDRTSPGYAIGDVSRVRIGADLSFSIAGFRWESEYIKVNHSLTDAQSATLSFLHLMVSPMVPTSLDKVFYYGALTYNITDDLFIYGKYDYLKDEGSPGLTDGIKGYSIGGGYKPSDDILLKIQYQNAEINDPSIVKYSENAFYVGASIFF
jgi:hypothetical protein